MEEIAFQLTLPLVEDFLEDKCRAAECPMCEGSYFDFLPLDPVNLSKFEIECNGCGYIINFGLKGIKRWVSENHKNINFDKEYLTFNGHFYSSAASDGYNYRLKVVENSTKIALQRSKAIPKEQTIIKEKIKRIDNKIDKIIVWLYIICPFLVTASISVIKHTWFK